MTDSYNQSNINLAEATPLVVATPDITPVLVTLGTIVDGQTLTVDLDGGGSAPISAGNAGGVAAANYSISTGDTTFAREAGAGVVAGAAIAIVNATGAPPVLTFVLDDVTTPGVTICQLSIVGPAFVYNHNLRYSAVQF